MKNNLTLTIGIFLVLTLLIINVNMVSALEFDNWKSTKDIKQNEVLDIGLKAIPYQEIWSKYKPIEINNAFGLGEKLFTGAIIEHTSECSNNCESIIEVYLENDGVLIQDVLWEKQVNGKWVDLDFNNYQIWVQNKETTEERDVYETQCNPTGKLNINGTAETICERVKIGTEIVELPEYRLLNIGEEVEAGNYRIKIEGGKKPQTILDWKIKTQGIVLSEWAEWGSSGSGFSYITLNSPEDGNISYTPNINFNCSANVVGANLININLWTNENGSWALKNTSEQRGTELIYDTYDSIINNLKWTNSSTGGLSILENANKIYSIKSYGLSEQTSYLQTNNLSLTNNLNNLTFRAVLSNTNQYDPYTSVRLSIFGTIIKSVAGSWGGTINDDSIWTIKRNFSAGMDKFDIYDDGSYATQITATNNIIELANLCDDGAASNSKTCIFEIYPVYYSLANIGNPIFQETITSNILWNCQACDSDGDCGFAPSNYTLFIDENAPIININSGNGTQNYGNLLTNHTINYTITDSNLDSCWLNYNSTNRTIPCTSGAMNTTNFALQLGLYEATIYANDSLGNVESESFEWEYKVFENSRSFNTTSYETSYEDYLINVTANTSLTNIYLNYNGTSLQMTNLGSGIWSYSRDLPSSTIGANTFNYQFLYAGETISSYNSTQTISPIIFGICNATITNDFLNITFKDEETLTSINATIVNSIFEYYLGNGGETKTYLYSTTNNYSNYVFCATPTDKTFNVIPYVQYSFSDYPQRVWNPIAQPYTSAVTNQILYLLGSVDGIYVTYQVTNVADQILSGVDVNAIRTFSGTNVTIGTGTTEADGTVTFWMNPDFYHYVIFSKTGFQDYIFYHAPTQTSYTIQMGTTGETEDTDYIKGITYWILPSNKTLFNNTAYTFAFNLSSSFWDVSSFGFNLRLLNGTVLDSDSSSTLESPAEVSFNTESYKRIYMDYYWLINGTYINGTIYWNVMNSENTEWSIKYFFDDLNGILDTGLFGIDEFGKKLIIFLILFFSVGIVGYKFGATSPLTISAITFAIIFFFDVAVDIIPDVGGINNLLTYLSALILVILIFREVQT